ncbi:MAG: DUF447 family protein [Candidatus Methanomethylicia archaeon]
MAVKLGDLGFLRDVILETVVSTYGVDGKPNAAPMGVIMRDECHVVIKPFTSSSTYSNLQLRLCGVVNIVSDPKIFYLTAFKEANVDGVLPFEWFDRAEMVDAPRLRVAEAFIEFSVVDIKLLEVGRAEVLCRVESIKASNTLPKAYCRASFAVIESIIHATRIKSFLRDYVREKENILKLLDLIKYYYGIVVRVAPNSYYSEIMIDLMKRISSWGIRFEDLC